MTATRTITLTFDVAARTEGELPTPDLLREHIQHDLNLHAIARADEHWITAIGVPPQPADDAEEDESIEPGSPTRSDKYPTPDAHSPPPA